MPWTVRKIDAARGAGTAHAAGLYLWTGGHVKRLFPGFENLAADIYWIRTVQYFGGTKAFSKDSNFELLEPLTDITVTLDPRFDIAYRYGAVFLAEPQPAGAGRPQSAVALLDRGVKANPLNWRMKKELAYFHYVFLDDARTAARLLLEAAEIPDAAWWLRPMAADVLGRGADRATARRMWLQMYQDEEVGALKNNALIHLKILDALDGRDDLQRRVDEFTLRTGRRPHSIHELVASGALAREPVDPSSVPYDYSPETGRVAISEKSTLWRPGQ